MTVDAAGPVERSRFASGNSGSCLSTWNRRNAWSYRTVVPIWLGMHVHDLVWRVPEAVFLCRNLHHTGIPTLFCKHVAVQLSACTLTEILRKDSRFSPFLRRRNHIATADFVVVFHLTLLFCLHMSFPNIAYAVGVPLL
jgi:hypothetical protein